MGRKPALKNGKDKLDLLQMRANGLSNQEIAQHFGVAPSTVYKLYDDIDGEISKKAPFIQQFVRQLELTLSEKLRLVLEQIDETKISDASLSVLGQTAQILNNMRRLEGGQSTQVTEVKYSKVDIDEFRQATQPLDITEDAVIVADDTSKSVVQNNERVSDNIE